ncbi:glycyl-radical enzyme activating protein [Faecalicoccus pleomorphus]|uniref:Glycyl-radical enzyme activating protein n=2 Tax=Faecalicoccus pleomorphus TaxID=1323 RepID=A0AAW6CUE7_9FIRM|nr:glycyl-radical enzyme activating protein [Faecalicoccus pleomorphus]MDB7979826.1 glycyl-radical enzyme activating protein [Faecalicoccus pleomorphus]MDB7982089.1 glycyl-radical enzyme activating protein [Faecalicoccus pleomorphus]
MSMTKGLIFNIQKFSIHDGPGIRTTIFLKGCPLRCKWCANPESQSAHVQILWDQKKCVHCLQCVKSCMYQAISCREGEIHIDEALCQGCLNCVSTCLQSALSNEGETKEIEEIVRIALQDKDFYEESGGGITISGGEGMSQPYFLKELVKELKKHNLHLAIETTGYIPKETFHELAPLFDLLLFDVKHYDTNRHFEGTGVHNEQIINNLKWATHQGLEILPRIPVIPGFNDSIQDAAGLASLLTEIGLKKVQLLPFHQFGERKYEMMHKEYAYKNVKALQKEDLTEYQNEFTKKGLDCFF